MKKATKIKKGITLITLVITIVIILILAAAIIITISVNNPISEANEAVLRNDLQIIKEQYQLVYAEKLLEYGGDKSKITEEDLQGIVPEKYQPDFVALPEGPAYVGDDEKIKEIAKDMGYIIGYPSKEIVIEYVNTKADINSIIVDVGIKEFQLVEKIEYRISTDSKNWTMEESTQTTHEFGGLNQNTKYYIKVVVIGKEGQKVESKIYEVTTKAEDFEAGQVTIRKRNNAGEIYETGK